MGNGGFVQYVIIAGINDKQFLRMGGEG